MLVNRDPDGVPEITDEMLRMAREMRLHVINVVCDEPGAKVGDHTGISFFALVSFIPRAGDRIGLENGRACEVKRVHYKIVKSTGQDGAPDAILLFPNVFAQLLPGAEADGG